jgi:hypothetical protein
MQGTWTFVAMEYYALILNRTYLVSVDDVGLSAAVCRGLTAVKAGAGLTRRITGHLAVHGDLNDPDSYVSQQLVTRHSKANFAINHPNITSVIYNPGKKWGMGSYPHDGRVIVNTETQRREFIIIGNQSGKEIADRLSATVGGANNSFKPKPLRSSA